MEGNLITLSNGLVVSVDWLSFTVMSTADVVDVLDMFGYVMDDFTRMPKGASAFCVMVTRTWVYILMWPVLP